MKTTKRQRGIDSGDSLDGLSVRVAALETLVAGLTALRGTLNADAAREFYSTADLARAKRVSVYTVTARWCSTGRIEAVKDEETGRWKIPAREYRRLVAGGGLRPKAR